MLISCLKSLFCCFVGDLDRPKGNEKEGHHQNPPDGMNKSGSGRDSELLEVANAEISEAINNSAMKPEEKLGRCEEKEEGCGGLAGGCLGGSGGGSVQEVANIFHPYIRSSELLGGAIFRQAKLVVKLLQNMSNGLAVTSEIFKIKNVSDVEIDWPQFNHLKMIEQGVNRISRLKEQFSDQMLNNILASGRFHCDRIKEQYPRNSIHVLWINSWVDGVKKFQLAWTMSHCEKKRMQGIREAVKLQKLAEVQKLLGELSVRKKVEVVEEVKPLIKDISNDRRVKELLAELFGDRVYLETIMNEADTETELGRDNIAEANKAIVFLDKKAEFWRQESPAPRKRKTERLPTVATERAQENQWVTDVMNQIGDESKMSTQHTVQLLCCPPHRPNSESDFVKELCVSAAKDLLNIMCQPDFGNF